MKPYKHANIFVIVAILAGIFWLGYITYSLFIEAASKDTTQELDLFYMYGDENGAFLLEPTAEYENVIFVPREMLEELEPFPTELGERFTGTFDAEGWELLELNHKEEK